MNSKTIRESTWGKEKFEYPKLEEIVINRDYAFTINVAPAYQKTSFFENQMQLMDILADLVRPYAKYEMRPEISTKSTLYHAHGTINFPSYSKLLQFYAFKIKQLKEFCTFTIKDIDDWRWHVYCRKQRHIIKPYLAHTYDKIYLPYRMTHLNATKKAKLDL